MNLRPMEHVTDKKFVLAKRGRFKKEGKYILKHVCACGAEFYAGSSALRCRECEVTHRRYMKRFYYQRAKNGKDRLAR